MEKENSRNFNKYNYKNNFPNQSLEEWNAAMLSTITPLHWTVGCLKPSTVLVQVVTVLLKGRQPVLHRSMHEWITFKLTHEGWNERLFKGTWLDWFLTLRLKKMWKQIIFSQREPFYTICRNVNWYGHCRECYGDSSRKLKIELPFDLAIPLLGIHLEKKNVIQKDTCTPMLIEGLFTIAKTWQQPECPPKGEW